jgi:hypothetical protein
MRRSIKYLLLTVFMASTFFACENVDFGDTNANPNGAEKPATSGLFSGAIMTYATLTNRNGITIPTLMVQYQSQVTYTDEMLYAQTPYSWTAYYVNIINPLNQVIAITSDPAQVTPEVLLQGSAANQQATARIFKAIVMKRVTDLWGDVPYSQSVKGLENVTPAYDAQEDIYKGLIADVKAARDLIVTTEKAPTGDILLKGNMANWKKLANSLLMQMAIQLSKRYPDPAGFAATTFNEALGNAGGRIETVADEAWFSFVDLNGFRNPWNANRTADYFLTQEFTDALKGNTGGTSLNPTTNHTADERAKVFVRTQGTNGVPYGYNNSSGAGKAQMNRLYYWNATSPLPLMTASYTYLNRAEARQLGWTTESTTAVLLKTGIERSFETLEAHSKTSVANPAGVTFTTKSTYADQRVLDAATFGFARVIAE